MRDIDFIRYLIDLIDAKKEAECEPEVAEIVQPAPPAVQPVIVNVKVNGQGGGSATAGVDPDEVDSPIDRDDVFIPPLQAKLEMMKKMTGVEPKNQELMTSEDDEPFDG